MMRFKTKVRNVARRYSAVAIDYIVFMIWGGLIFLLSPIVSPLFLKSQAVAQFAGFFFIVLPFALYLFFFENSHWCATVGKKLLRLKVCRIDNQKASPMQVFVRVFVRLLPWELAHYAVWSIYYTHGEINFAATICLLIANTYLLVEILFPFFNHNGYTLHDVLSKTKLVYLNQQSSSKSL